MVQNRISGYPFATTPHSLAVASSCISQRIRTMQAAEKRLWRTANAAAGMCFKVWFSMFCCRDILARLLQQKVVRKQNCLPTAISLVRKQRQLPPLIYFYKLPLLLHQYRKTQAKQPRQHEDRKTVRPSLRTVVDAQFVRSISGQAPAGRSGPRHKSRAKLCTIPPTHHTVRYSPPRMVASFGELQQQPCRTADLDRRLD